MTAGWLLWVMLGCNSFPNPSAKDPPGPPDGADPPATSGLADGPQSGPMDPVPGYWDTSPDTGWMAEYPTYACPTPDEDDTVVELYTWSLLFEAFQGTDGDPDLLMQLSGLTSGHGPCPLIGWDLDVIKTYGEPGEMDFTGRFWVRDFSPGKLEGINTWPASSWDKRAVIGYRDGEHWRPLMVPEPPRGTPGDTPYQDMCFVRVRPHRVVGVWRIHAPPEVFEQFRWPEELWGGLFVKWDVRWGEGINEYSGTTCFFDDYWDVEPQDIWPEWPKGWDVSSTWDGR